VSTLPQSPLSESKREVAFHAFKKQLVTKTFPRQENACLSDSVYMEYTPFVLSLCRFLPKIIQAERVQNQRKGSHVKPLCYDFFKIKKKNIYIYIYICLSNNFSIVNVYSKRHIICTTLTRQWQNNVDVSSFFLL
jgi:hypothetical protein